jgi:rhodanese-related sulfurtransferase
VQERLLQGGPRFLGSAMEPTIDSSELYARLEDEEVLVVDCRPDEDWDGLQLQIPGALQMNVDELFAAALSLPDDELIVLCGSSADHADARMAHRLLLARGRVSVILRGGIWAWVEAGLPTEPRGPRHGAAPVGP